MSRLAGWDESVFEAEGRGYPVFRKGSGPGVIIIHEIPGITPKVRGFAEEVVDAGFTVVMPSLFGTPDKEMSTGEIVKSLAKVCVSKEFMTMATGQTSPIATWTRALAASLHEELGGPGVGALGMCFSGGLPPGADSTRRSAHPRLHVRARGRSLTQPSTPQGHAAAVTAVAA